MQGSREQMKSPIAPLQLCAAQAPLPELAVLAEQAPAARGAAMVYRR